jgi:hypothetical protein
MRAKVAVTKEPRLGPSSCCKFELWPCVLAKAEKKIESFSAAGFFPAFWNWRFLEIPQWLVGMPALFFFALISRQKSRSNKHKAPLLLTCRSLTKTSPSMYIPLLPFYCLHHPRP